MLYRCLDLKLIDEPIYIFNQTNIRVEDGENGANGRCTSFTRIRGFKKKYINAFNIKNEMQLIQKMSIPQEYIEMLCNLAQGTLNYNEPEPTIRLIKR